MKNTCPYCNENTITFWQKFTASDLSPAICKGCGKPSAKSKFLAGVDAILGSVGFWGVILGALFLESWWPLIGFGIFIIVYSILTFLYVPMAAVNEKAVRKKYWFIFGALVMLLIWLVVDALDI